jgi:hypothetical protein
MADSTFKEKMAGDFSIEYYQAFKAANISGPVLVSAACSEQHGALKLRTLLVSLQDSVKSIDNLLNLKIMRDILNGPDSLSARSLVCHVLLDFARDPAARQTCRLCRQGLWRMTVARLRTILLKRWWNDGISKRTVMLLTQRPTAFTRASPLYSNQMDWEYLTSWISCWTARLSNPSTLLVDW